MRFNNNQQKVYSISSVNIRLNLLLFYLNNNLWQDLNLLISVVSGQSNLKIEIAIKSFMPKIISLPKNI